MANQAVSHSADVIIIGGGIVGCATAYYLAKCGVEILLIERRGIGSGASGRSGGGVRQSARATEEMPLAQESIALFPSLSDELGLDLEYTRTGNLRLVEIPDHVRPMQLDIARQQALGLDLRWLGPEEVRELAPMLDQEQVLGASFCSTDGHCNPFRLVTGFYQAAVRAGGSVWLGHEVHAIRQIEAGQVLVEAGDRIARAPTVLIAAGAGSLKLCLKLGFDLPLANMCYESMITEVIPPLFPYMFGVATGDLFFRQTQHGGIHFGGGTIAPSEVERTTRTNLKLAVEHLTRLMPSLRQVPLMRTWGGLDPNTPDGMPIIDRLNENVILATGFCGHGLAIGPMVGRYLADWISTDDKPAPLAPFPHDRFKRWLRTRWTPSGTFEAALATDTTHSIQISNGGVQARTPTLRSSDGQSGIKVGTKSEIENTHLLESRRTPPREGEALWPQRPKPSGDGQLKTQSLLAINPDLCTGCRMCEMACSIAHEQMILPTDSLRIRVAYPSDDFFVPMTCIHCEEVYCMKSCPFEALILEGSPGIIKVIDENCTGCMLCIKACPYGGIHFVEEKKTVIKCDLCGGDPACATYCPTQAITFTPLSLETWDQMKQTAIDNLWALVEKDQLRTKRKKRGKQSTK